MGEVFRCAVDVRWGDLDQLGHVNNVKYLEYAMEARVAFYKARLSTFDATGHAVVLRRTTVDYLRQVTHDSGPLAVEVDVTHIGTTSYTMRHRMFDARGDECAVVDAVMVSFDLTTQQTRALSAPERAILADHLAPDPVR